MKTFKLRIEAIAYSQDEAKARIKEMLAKLSDESKGEITERDAAGFTIALWKRYGTDGKQIE